MKVNLLLVFLVLPFLSLAQKYHPFPFKTIQYSYAEGDSLYILKKDPLSSNGEIYFNPIVKFDPEEFWRGTLDSNNIFGQKLLTISDTAYIFVSAEKDSFFIYPYAKLNTPFEFAKTVEAQIISREKELVLGLMDSVITIELTTGEIIKLSENYGFVQTTRLDQLGKKSAMNFMLSAIPEANLGRYFYDPANIYDFEVGDVFVYENISEISGFVTFRSLTRKEVIKKEVYADSIVYTFKENVRVFRSYTHEKESFSEREIKNVILTSITEDFATSSLSAASLFGGSGYYKIPGAIGRNAKGRFSVIISGLYYKEDNEPLVEMVVDAGGFNRYTTGLGLERDEEGPLVCYTKQNESYGDCDSLYKVVLSNKPSKISESISIFPNPAKDKITISNLDKGQCSIWSITGQRISEQNINSSGELDISRLSSGIYMLIVDRPEGNLHLRFEKL
jgi:hypothetical protein